MIIRAFLRLLSGASPLVLAKFLWNFVFRGICAVELFKRRVKRGVRVPAFVFVSVTNRCNLECRGCWVAKTDPPRDISLELLDKIISDFKSRGSRFFGILGGEPLMLDGLLDALGKHKDCYFQIFTNGILLDDTLCSKMRSIGNMTPLVSIEGFEKESDRRRGGANVFAKSAKGLDSCRKNRLVFGTASSICKSNIDELLSENFLDFLIAKGVHYVWYYIYRPSGDNPCAHEALDREDVARLRRFIVEQRRRKPLFIIDAYWDHDGEALCPAAIGISHHVNPIGEIEPCPVIQFAKDSLTKTHDAFELFRNSEFLEQFRKFAAEKSHACIYLQNPKLMLEFMANSGARPSSGDAMQLERLRKLAALPDHDMGEAKMPEKSFFYRFAKKYWFFGFGAYG